MALPKSMMGLTNAALMRVEVVRLSPFSAYRDAARQMHKSRAQYAVVELRGRLLGLLSERDFAGLPSAVHTPADADTADEASVMSICLRDPFTAVPGGSAVLSAQFMLHKGIRCMPVVDEASGVVGLLILGDLLRSLAHHEETRDDLAAASVALAANSPSS